MPRTKKKTEQKKKSTSKTNTHAQMEKDYEDTGTKGGESSFIEKDYEEVYQRTGNDGAEEL